MTDGWTFRTLKAWIEARIQTLDAVLAERAKAIEVQLANFEKRMDSTNEWRAALDDVTRTRASKESLAAIDSRVDKLEAAMLKQGSKAEGFSLAGTRLIAGLGAVGTVFGIIAVILVFNQ